MAEIPGGKYSSRSLEAALIHAQAGRESPSALGAGRVPVLSTQESPALRQRRKEEIILSDSLSPPFLDVAASFICFSPVSLHWFNWRRLFALLQVGRWTKVRTMLSLISGLTTKQREEVLIYPGGQIIGNLSLDRDQSEKGRKRVKTKVRRHQVQITDLDWGEELQRQTGDVTSGKEQRWTQGFLWVPSSLRDPRIPSASLTDN